MTGLNEHKYLIWLENQITPDRDRMYTDLFSALFEKEFIWITPNDDNRIADAMDIRCEFFRRHGALTRACSVLEVIIGISRRMSFAAGGDSDRWAWQLIANLELGRMTGHIGRVRAEHIDEILERFIWRLYKPDGTGGLFPLAWPKADQRKIELWYQMCAYIEELPEL